MWKIGLLSIDGVGPGRRKIEKLFNLPAERVSILPKDFCDGFSFTTSSDTLFDLSLFTLFWCFSIGIVFFGMIGELDRDDADSGPSELFGCGDDKNLFSSC
jgi:hypothetical protein